MIFNNFHIKVAQSLLKTATSQKIEDKVAADMEGLMTLMKNPQFKVLFQNVALLTPQGSEKVLKATFHGKLQDLTLQVLVLLAQQQALKYVGKIAQVYRKNYHEMKGIKEITIRTAREFSPQEQLAFVQKIQGKKSNSITVKFEVDESLIAGAQIYEGSYLTDYSVRNYLDTLKKHLTNTQLN